MFFSDRRCACFFMSKLAFRAQFLTNFWTCEHSFRSDPTAFFEVFANSKQSRRQRYQCDFWIQKASEITQNSFQDPANHWLLQPRGMPTLGCSDAEIGSEHFFAEKIALGAISWDSDAILVDLCASRGGFGASGKPCWTILGCIFSFSVSLKASLWRQPRSACKKRVCRRLD